MEYLEYSRLLIQPIQQWGFHHVTTAEGFNCEGGAEGPPFGGDKPNEVFAVGPADSRSLCPLTRLLRARTLQSPIHVLTLAIICFFLVGPLPPTRRNLNSPWFSERVMFNCVCFVGCVLLELA